MFSLTLIVIVVLALWVGGFAYYLYLSRQQENIAEELESVKNKLNQGDAGSDKG